MFGGYACHFRWLLLVIVDYLESENLLQYTSLGSTSALVDGFVDI